METTYMRPTKATLYVKLDNNEPDHQVTPSDLREFDLVEGRKAFLDLRTILDNALSESRGNIHTNPELGVIKDILNLILWQNPDLQRDSTVETIKGLTTQLAGVLSETREARTTVQSSE